MFDISELGKPYTQELIVDIAEDPKGNHPIVIIEITKEIRKKESRYAAQLGRLEFDTSGIDEDQKATWISEKLEYCEKMARLCVKDSNGLFWEKGKEVPHKLEYFCDALIQSKEFRDWFAEAITDVFAEDKARIGMKKVAIVQD